jgi:tetratricopeptide (TPR) repeat protein
MQELLRVHARLSWQVSCAIRGMDCAADTVNRDETSFSDPPSSLHLDALENFIRGLTASGDEERLRLLREASRLEPAWDRPSFELGLIYFWRRDCELALPWFSRVPPNRPDGPEASFDTGVCHLLRNDAGRADAAFSGLIERSRSTDDKQLLPDFPEVRNNLGVVRVRQGKWSEAEIEFERAETLDPGEPDFWVNSGICKLAEKQTSASVSQFETALKLNSDDKDARAILISVLQSLGRKSDADAVRGESAESAAHLMQPNLQDTAALVRLTRMSRKFDRALLRPIGDPAATRPAPGTAANRPPIKADPK